MLFAVLIIEYAPTIYLAISPLAFVDASVWPFKSAVSIHLVVVPGTSVLRAILRDVDTVAPDGAIIVLSFECKLVWHGEAALSVRFVILPHAVIEVAVRIRPTAFSMGPIVDPIAFIGGSVWPDLRTVSLACLGALKPLSLIARTVE